MPWLGDPHSWWETLRFGGYKMKLLNIESLIPYLGRGKVSANNYHGGYQQLDIEPISKCNLLLQRDKCLQCAVAGIMRNANLRWHNYFPSPNRPEPGVSGLCCVLCCSSLCAVSGVSGVA